MNRFSLKFTISFALLLGIIFGSAFIAKAQNSDPAKQALIERFQQNRRTDPKVAYEVAKEFLQKYSDDTSDDAQTIKKWVAAYEKVEKDKLSGNSNNSNDSSAQQDTNKKEPTIAETINWLRKVFTSEDIKFAEGDAIFNYSQRITNYDDCSLVVENTQIHQYENSARKRTDAEKATIDLRKVNVSSQVSISDSKENPTFYILYLSGDGIKGTDTVTEESSAFNNKTGRFDSKDIDKDVSTIDGVVYSGIYRFSTKEMAERVQRAFDHAITLCKQTKSNDPF